MVRMISIMDNTYERLKGIKGDKSFSKALNELMDEKSARIMKFAGILGNERSSSEITALRKQDKIAEQKRAKQLEKKTG